MHFALSLLFLASVPAALAAPKNCKKSLGLHGLAQQAGLKYFASATDTPGQRERAGYESVYPQYDQIMWKSGEFGGTTPCNGQKWAFVEPEQGVFNFTEGEVVSGLVAKNGFQYMRCHALVWHSQLAPWVEAGNFTKQELSDIVVNHIKNVMGHWKGRCYAWDVVNEALNDDGTFRETVFYNTIGEDYIKLAFQTAAAVDPKAKLYYNDYNLEYPSAKTVAAQNLVKSLKKAGVKIDGVGLQSHEIAESFPTVDQHLDAMRGFTNLGVEIALTELDVRMVLPDNSTNLAWQAQAYHNIVGACVQVKGCIGITLWDFYDPFSWVPGVFSGQGVPLLWFSNFTHHPAYDTVVSALTNKTVRH